MLRTAPREATHIPGRIRSSAYRAGALDGETLDFFPSSAAEAVRSRSEYRAGLLNGAVTQYAEDGRALMCAWFDQGQPVWTTTCRWDTCAPDPACGPGATHALDAPSPAAPVVDGTHGPASAHPPSTGDAGDGAASPSPDPPATPSALATPAAPAPADDSAPAGADAHVEPDAPDLLPAPADVAVAEAPADDALEDREGPAAARENPSLLSRIVDAWKRFWARRAARRRRGAETDIHQEHGR